MIVVARRVGSTRGIWEGSKRLGAGCGGGGEGRGGVESRVGVGGLVVRGGDGEGERFGDEKRRFRRFCSGFDCLVPGMRVVGAGSDDSTASSADVGSITCDGSSEGVAITVDSSGIC